jgi:hypothetical protein
MPQLEYIANYPQPSNVKEKLRSWLIIHFVPAPLSSLVFVGVIMVWLSHDQRKCSYPAGAAMRSLR